MKQEYPTYLKTIGKSKALTATLSDTKPEDDYDNEEDGILDAFTAIVNPTEGLVEDVDEEENLVESKFVKMDEQDDIHTAYAKLYKVSEKHDKLYRLATKKLSDVELEREEISTKLIKLLEHYGLKTISWLRRLRNLRQSYSKSELSWRRLQMQSSTRCLKAVWIEFFDNSILCFHNS